MPVECEPALETNAEAAADAGALVRRQLDTLRSAQLAGEKAAVAVLILSCLLPAGFWSRLESMNVLNLVGFCGAASAVLLLQLLAANRLAKTLGVVPQVRFACNLAALCPVLGWLMLLYLNSEARLQIQLLDQSLEDAVAADDGIPG